MPEHQHERVLGLLAKQPLPGMVKTRLAAETSRDFAAQVAAAFLTDSVERLAGIEARRVLAYAPPEAEPFFSQLVQDRFALVPQVEGDLGRRMAAFFQDQFQAGARKVVLLGVDSPTLPLSYIEEAFNKLDRADLVLGPATDGGYYLVGCSAGRIANRLPPIFENMTWSQPDVLEATIARLHDFSWKLELLPPWYDVDTLNDWRMFRGHLAAMHRAGVNPGLPRTEALAMESGSW
jgi:rSAM/selenodomain-associated transferase 1